MRTVVTIRSATPEDMGVHPKHRGERLTFDDYLRVPTIWERAQGPLQMALALVGVSAALLYVVL